MLKPIYMVFSLALLLAMLVDSSAQSRRHPSHNSPPNKTSTEQQNTEQEKRGTDEEPLSVKVVPTVEQKSDADDLKHDRKTQIADEMELVKDTGYQIGIGIIQAGVFILQLIAFSVQAYYLRRTVAEMQSTTGAAIRAANAAEGTLGHMRATAERQLRAYVFVAPVAIANVSPDLVMIGFYSFINHGHTPAHRIVQASVIRLEQHPLPPDFPFPALAGIARPSRISLPPGLPLGGQGLAERSFTQNEIIELLQAPMQGRRLYIFGQTDYIDTFGTPRWTRFCISFQGRHDLVLLAQQGNWDDIGKILASPGSSFTFEFANQHNDSEYE